MNNKISMINIDWMMIKVNVKVKINLMNDPSCDDIDGKWIIHIPLLKRVSL